MTATSAKPAAPDRRLPSRERTPAMMKPSLAAIFASSLIGAAAIAQTPQPSPALPVSTAFPKTFTLEVDAADLQLLGAAINELPKRVADPLAAKLNAQIQRQMDAAAPAQGEG